MHCVRVKNGSLGGVFSRRAAWSQRWMEAAWAGIVLLAILTLAGGFALRS